MLTSQQKRECNKLAKDNDVVAFCEYYNIFTPDSFQNIIDGLGADTVFGDDTTQSEKVFRYFLLLKWRDIPDSYFKDLKPEDRQNYRRYNLKMNEDENKKFVATFESRSDSEYCYSFNCFNSKKDMIFTIFENLTAIEELFKNELKERKSNG